MVVEDREYVIIGNDRFYMYENNKLFSLGSWYRSVWYRIFKIKYFTWLETKHYTLERHEIIDLTNNLESVYSCDANRYNKLSKKLNPFNPETAEMFLIYILKQHNIPRKYIMEFYGVDNFYFLEECLSILI